MTPAREKKIKDTLARRWKDVAVVIENVDDPHNVGAILRSCDAFGVGEVHLLYHQGMSPPYEGGDARRAEGVRLHRAPRNQELKMKAAASAAKWLTIKKWDSVAKLVKELKKKKRKIVVTTLAGRTVDPTKADLTGSLAIAIGNEHEGVSKELLEAADLRLKIPMRGFVQSFNVSVATALVLYEMVRQRK